MPRRTSRGRRRRKSTAQPVQTERRLSTEQMAVELVKAGLAPRTILTHQTWEPFDGNRKSQQ